MKIDVSCIDHNSAALTRDALDGDYTGAADKDNYDRIVIGMELKGEYFQIAKDRIQEAETAAMMEGE